MVRYVRGTCLQSEDKTLPYIMQTYFSDLALLHSREERSWETKWKRSGQRPLHVQSDRTVLVKGCIGTTQTRMARNHARFIFPF